MKNNFPFPGVLWILLTLICIVLILNGLDAALKKSGLQKNARQKIVRAATISIGCWIALLTILSCNRFFADFSKLPPRPALAILIPLPVVLLFAFSKKGAALLRSVPPHWLVWMQSFRIAVELMLLLAFLNGKLPGQMTFEGRNFDMLSGLLALPVGWVLTRRKSYAVKLAIAFNIIGILLLLNILAIALLSMPTSFRYFMNEPSSAMVAQFPFILLPGVLVPLAYTLHILSLRQLLTKQLSNAI